MQVYKFGGSSVGTPERIGKVLNIIETATRQPGALAVVFSAYQGITNQLIGMGQQAARGDQKYIQILRKMEDRHISVVQSLIGIKSRSSALTQLKT